MVRRNIDIFNNYINAHFVQHGSRHYYQQTSKDFSAHVQFILVKNSPSYINPLNAELNLICYLLALLGAHHFLNVSRIRVKSLILRLLMLSIYGAPILDVSRSHTTTHHSR